MDNWHELHYKEGRMKEKILYTGADISLFEKVEGVLHFPLTSFSVKDYESCEIKNEFETIYDYSHILFTTKYAVQSFLYFIDKYKISKNYLEGIHILAFGANCIELLERAGIYVTYVGSDETEEGVIRMLNTIDLTEAKVLLPQSDMKKPKLVHFLVEKRVNYTIVILYDLIKKLPYAKVNLDDFTQIVFSSPLAVEVFCDLFEDLPAHLEVHTMGLMTRCKVRSCLRKIAKKIDKKILL